MYIKLPLKWCSVRFITRTSYREINRNTYVKLLQNTITSTWSLTIAYRSPFFLHYSTLSRHLHSATYLQCRVSTTLTFEAIITPPNSHRYVPRFVISNMNSRPLVGRCATCGHLWLPIEAHWGPLSSSYLGINVYMVWSFLNGYKAQLVDKIKYFSQYCTPKNTVGRNT